MKAVQWGKNKAQPHPKLTAAANALRKLKESDRKRILTLFLNAQYVAKINRHLSDYKTLCGLDKAKGSEMGQTYLNEKAALRLVIKAILQCLHITLTNSN